MKQKQTQYKVSVKLRSTLKKDKNTVFRLLTKLEKTWNYFRKQIGINQSTQYSFSENKKCLFIAVYIMVNRIKDRLNLNNWIYQSTFVSELIVN